MPNVGIQLVYRDIGIGIRMLGFRLQILGLGRELVRIWTGKIVAFS